MNTTLGKQRERLISELSQAQIELARIQRESCPNFKMLNMYVDLIARNKQLIEMIDCHLFNEEEALNQSAH